MLKTIMHCTLYMLWFYIQQLHNFSQVKTYIFLFILFLWCILYAAGDNKDIYEMTATLALNSHIQRTRYSAHSFRRRGATRAQRGCSEQNGAIPVSPKYRKGF